MSRSSSGLRLVIVGGVAGGASAAARARRLSESAQITLIERGPAVSFANCGLPYHLSGVIPERSQLLVQTPASLRARFELDVRILTEAVSVDRGQKKLRLRNLESGQEEWLPYDKLILSPGAEGWRPDLPGLNSPRVFGFQTLADMDAVLSQVNAGARRVAVIGGGFIGLEVAENLSRRGLSVTLVEAAPQVFAPFDADFAAVLHQEIRRNGVSLLLNSRLKSIREEQDKILLVDLEGQEQPVAVDFAVVAMGVRPRVALAREAGLKIGVTGGILVNERLETSDPDIYAVGDAVEVPHLLTGQAAWIALAGPANRQGRLAAENALGGNKTYRGTLGTSVCQVFDLTAAATGFSERALTKQGRSFESITIHPSHHAGYYPGAAQMSLKLLFDRVDGLILGAQIVGTQGVDKRIDVLSTALQAKMRVQDLEELELAYAPPYGSAKDPVNFAGFVASNVISGHHRLMHGSEWKKNGASSGALLLDVRTPREFSAGSIPGAKNIPLDELRSQLGTLSKERPIVTYCQVGMRGYVAQRLLTESGYDARNLVGGYKSWKLENVSL